MYDVGGRVYIDEVEYNGMDSHGFTVAIMLNGGAEGGKIVGYVNGVFFLI